MTWDERETELGWYSCWLAAVSLTEQWWAFPLVLSHSLSLPPSPVQLSLGKCQRSGNGSGFQFFRWHLPWFVRGLQPIVRYSFFFLLFRATCNSCECSATASSMLFANIYFDVCQLSLGKVALKCGRPPVPMLSLFNWNWKTWKDPFEQPAMGSMPVFHMWFMHDISFVYLTPFCLGKPRSPLNLESIGLV